jgi:hypothetical protein
MGRAMMRVASWLMSSSALAVGLLLGSVGQAQAGSLNPFDFASLGAFPSAPGTYIFDTSDATLSGPGGSWTGVVYNGIAVFDFNSINVTGGQYFSGGSGSLPLALLSRSDAVVSGTIDVSANSPVGGPGGGGGGVPGGGGSAYSASPGAGPGGGGGGLTPMPSGQPQLSSGGGGGGFGGAGGIGAAGASSSNMFPGYIPLPGGAGGASYGNLGVQLQGGSGGGGAVYGTGGGGGGAIELVAVGSLGIYGAILANGLNGTSFNWGAGGGSGGGIFLHADSVVLSGMLSAAGGSGEPGFVNPGPSDGNSSAGGGGGGGEVAIQGFFEGSLSNIDVSGGPSGGSGAVAGADGVIGIPEPASLVPMGTGVLFLLGVAWTRRKGSAPSTRNPS